MASNIDPAQPPAINPTTGAMRANMLAAKSEIDALQALVLPGLGGVPHYSTDGSQILGPRGSYSLRNNEAHIYYLGDSLGFSGVRYGALVPTPALFNGSVTIFLAQQGTNVVGSGLLEYRALDKALRYTAPGDTAGSWYPQTVSSRPRLLSGNGLLWIEGTVLQDLMPGADASGAITYAANPYVASMYRGVPECINSLTFNQIKHTNLTVPGCFIRHVVDQVNGITDQTAPLIVQVGSNNVIAEQTVATMTAELLLLLPLLAGRNVILCTVPGMGTSTAGRQLAWNKLNNSLLPDLCTTYRVPLVHCWASTIDPTSTTAPKANRMQSDANHPAAPAAMYAAKVLLPKLNLLGSDLFIPSPLNAYHVTNYPKGNLLTNPNFAGIAGTAGLGVTAGAGGIPDGMTALRSVGAGTAVVQKVIAPDGGNEYLEFTITGAAPGDVFRLETGTVGAGSTVPIPGDKIDGWVDWEHVAGTGGIRGVQFVMQPVTVTAPVGYSGFIADAMLIPDGVVGRTPKIQTPWEMPPGATAVRGQVHIIIGAATATVRIRNPVMVKI